MWAVDENKHTASDWNLPAVLIFQNGTWLEVIHRCSPPAAASCSPSSHGKRCTEEKNYRWAGEKKTTLGMNCNESDWREAFAQKSRNFFFKKPNNFIPLLLPHLIPFIIYVHITPLCDLPRTTILSQTATLIISCLYPTPKKSQSQP